MIGFHFCLLRLRAPDCFCRMVGSHYDRYPHASSGQWWHDCLLDPTLNRFQQFLTETSMYEHPSLSNMFNLLGKTPCVPGGLPLEILQCDFWVPLASTRAESPQFKGKDIFKEILSTSEATATLYAERVTQAWCSEPFMVVNSNLNLRLIT